MAFDTDDGAAGAGERDEFDAAFDEFSDNVSPPADQARQEPDEPEPAADDTRADDEATKDPEEPAQAAAAAEGDAAGNDAGTAPDIWAEAPPALKAAYDAERTAREAAAKRVETLEHASRSDRGRIASYQRQLKQLEAGDKPASKVLEREDIKKAKEEYGDVLGPVLDVIADQQARIDELHGQQQATSANQALEAEERLLAQQHPDWLDVAGSEAFGKWVGTQPRYIQDVIRRNAEGIVDHEEAADVIGRFKATIAPPPKTEADPIVPTPNDADAAATRRQRLLNSAPSVASDAGAHGKGVPDEFDAAFDHYAKADG